MQWERRKPLWPIKVALGLLLILALAAPRSWQSLDSRGSQQVAELQPSFPVIVQPATRSKQSMKQLAEAALSEPSPSEAAVEPPPIRREFTFDTLMQVRNQLLAFANQLPIPELPSPVLPTSRPATLPALRRVPPVRVSSENERLAMVPSRLPLLAQLPLPTSTVEVSQKEVTDFAAILLEASRRPERIEASLQAEPRLAIRPARPKPLEVPAQEEPQRIEPEPVELPPVTAPALKHRPLALVKQLEAFSANSRGAVWAQQVLSQLRLLTDESTSESPEVAETLALLEQLRASAIRAAATPAMPTYRSQWQQSAQALGRRLPLWQLLLDPDQPRITGTLPTSTALLPVLSDVATLLEAETSGSDWREYLLLDQIASATSENISSPALLRAKLAQKVLARMNDSLLTDAQLDFLARVPLVQLQQELRPWAASKVNLETLAALLERYELGREMRYAAVIAQLQKRLKWSDDPQLQALAIHLEQHYRGANMRLAVSGDLLNRMVPKQEPIITPVRDRVAGAKVRGHARTTTQLRVRLKPDPNAWHFALEAKGKVYSDTKSDTWPARVRNAAKLQYQASKEISINKQGLHVLPTQAKAQGRNELLGVDSKLDPVPIFGHLLRNMAKQKHARSRPTAINQAKAKVVRQAKKRMDEVTDQKLEVLEKLFRAKVLAPIEQLALLAEPLDMHTTEQRAVMQLRLANTGQLAAHTPRPLAPSDSVLSWQMHETALNNAMMGLGLDGRRMTMLELFHYLSQRFGQTGAAPPDDMPRKAVIEFAARDAVRVQCGKDRLELVFNVAELAYRRDKIKNFQIHVHFRPVLSGLDVRLTREGTLQFSGRRLKTGPRVVLHSVIGKLLGKDQEIRLLNAKFLKDPRLAGLMVTQLVIEDGWIGLALGPAIPRRTAWRAPTPEVLTTPFVR